MGKTVQVIPGIWHWKVAMYLHEDTWSCVIYTFLCESIKTMPLGWFKARSSKYNIYNNERNKEKEGVEREIPYSYSHDYFTHLK